MVIGAVRFFTQQIIFLRVKVNFANCQNVYESSNISLFKTDFSFSYSFEFTGYLCSTAFEPLRILISYKNNFKGKFIFSPKYRVSNLKVQI